MFTFTLQNASVYTREPTKRNIRIIGQVVVYQLSEVLAAHA